MWLALGFANNYGDYSCEPGSWALAVEGQMYLLTPPLVWCYLRDRRLGYGLVVALVLALIALRAWLLVSSGSNELCTFNTDDPVNDCALAGAVSVSLHTSAWSRAPEYLCGVVAAFAHLDRLAAERREPGESDDDDDDDGGEGGRARAKRPTPREPPPPPLRHAPGVFGDEIPVEEDGDDDGGGLASSELFGAIARGLSLIHI